ncbi:MAG TPA: pitrilysin family protein [Thermoanaerobaculia bacterium]|nr:pitrilysin family protein [Thermoanaerobaculia bacterium]
MTRRRIPFAEAVRQHTLGNGARLYVLENHFNPTLALSGSLDAGRLYAPADRRMVASVAAGELLKGTRHRTKLELAEALESRAASLSFAADAGEPVGLDIGGSALSRDAEILLDLLAEVLCEPTFPQEELEKEKKRLVGAIRQSQDQTSVRAYEAAMRRIYPEGHPLRRQTAQRRIEIAESLTREELAEHYEKRFGAATLRLVLVGDVEAERVLDGLEARFGTWRAGPSAEIPRVPAAAPAPGEETVVMPDKASADVVLAEPWDLVRTDPEFLPCLLANSILGQAALSSRLGVRVRDVEGLTYGIHSSFSAMHLAGPFVVSLTVRPDDREGAIAATRDEIERFLRGGMTVRELADEKTARVGKFKVDLASNAGLASAIDSAVSYGLGVGYLDRYPSLIESVTRHEANAAFARRVHPERFTVVSAGSFPASPARREGENRAVGSTGAV